MKNLFILLSFLFSTTCTFAQSESSSSYSDLNDPDSLKKAFVEPATRTIVYNFETGKYDRKLNQIRVHTPVVFEIRNINPFAYIIRITPKDSVLAASSFEKSMLQWISKTELQATQEQINQAESSQDAQTNKGAVVENVDVTKTESDDDAKTLEAVNSGLKITKENDATIAKVEQNKKELSEVEIRLQDEKITLADSQKLVMRRVKLIEEIEESQRIIQRKIDNADAKVKHFLDLRSDFMFAYSNYMIDCQRLFRIVKNARLLTTMAEDPGLSDTLFRKNYSLNFRQILLEIREDRNHFNNFRSTYSELNNLHALLKHDPDLQQLLEQSGINKLYAYPDYIKRKADALHARLVQIPIETYIKQSEWIATKFDSKEAFVYRSAPLQPINDWIEFKVDIVRKNGTISRDYYSERSFIYHQPTYGGTRVDFSLGLAASYFGSTPVYELGYPDPTEASGLFVYEKAKELIAPSLVGLVTMSVRRTKYIAFGGSAGLGIDVLNGKVQLSNFFIGPTALLGKFDRILLSGGASLRNVQKLERGYKVSESAGAAADISEILDDKYKVGVFLSVTYSLTENAKKMLQSF